MRPMKIATLKIENQEIAALVHGAGFVPLSAINRAFGLGFPVDILQILSLGRWRELCGWFALEGKKSLDNLASEWIARERASYAPLYRRPRKIWGIGLNYADHAADLSESAPKGEPASFMKPDTAIVGYGDHIELPLLSERTTGEAELGIVFCDQCRDVDNRDWKSVIAGFTTIIDMTAEDILRRNPRNLTQSKSFDTFFSFGPILYSADEFEEIDNLEVTTVLNNAVRATNTVRNMTFKPDHLVSYHSRIMTMLPGDIISTGTPGAAPLQDGDLVEARISGFEPLINPVRDLKRRGA